MKLYFGPYIDFLGPYQIAGKLCFWAKKEKDEFGFSKRPDWVHDFGTWLAEDRHGNDTWLTKICNRLHAKQKRKIKLKLHDYDTWNMSATVALIVLPLLKQMKERRNSSPFVDDEDVPDELKSTSAEPKENDCDIDSNHHRRWDYVVDEMIWAFEQLQPDCDWEKQYKSGNFDMRFEPLEGEGSNKKRCSSIWVKGPNHTFQVDEAGVKAHSERIRRGTMLFGKYFQSLGD